MRCGARIAQRSRSSASSTTRNGTLRKPERQAARGERNANYVRTATVALDNDDWGLVRHFATRDVRELKTRDWQLFIEKIAARRPDLSSSTRNTLMAAFRNVMKVVRDDGVIDVRAGYAARHRQR